MKNREQILNLVFHELERARAKFPDQDVWVTLAALTEEVGELNQAILQFTHEPEKNVTEDKIEKEAVQAIVMTLRVLLDAPHKAPFKAP